MRTFTLYFGKRVIQALVVILIVTVIAFVLLHLLPGGPAHGILGQQATQAQIDAFNHENGFDQPLWQQFFGYLNKLIHGDLGRSFVLNTDVKTVIAQRLPRTLILSLLAILVSLLVAIPLGMLQALKARRPVDTALTTITLILYSTPTFFLGLLLIMIFSQWLAWLPGDAPSGNSVREILSQPSHLILPVSTSAIAACVTLVRYLRSATIETLKEDYLQTARAKGTSGYRLIVRHVLRNSLTPVIAILGYYLPVMFGGALVVEQLFNYPGMGQLFWNAAQTSDYPVLLGCVLVIALATLVGSLLADLFQFLLDPRTRGAIL